MSWRKPTPIVLLSLVAHAWLAAVVIYFTDPSPATWVGTVAVAAFISEVAVWTTAAILGMSVIESRKRIWARIRAPFEQREQLEMKGSPFFEWPPFPCFPAHIWVPSLHARPE